MVKYIYNYIVIVIVFWSALVKITSVTGLTLERFNKVQKFKVVREFEEKATDTGHHSLIKDAVKYAKELDLDLKLSELNPTCRTADGNEVSGKQIGVWAKRLNSNNSGKKSQRRNGRESC